jgi:2OG-Fe(II) oxygenase superfamily
MANQSIQVEYHHGLQPLEKVLSTVRRAGDFFVHGRIDIPMPRFEVDGVGIISFPVLEMQLRQIIGQAERAPYGRGEKTILDTSVRKVWQLPPSKVHLSGKSWESSFQGIVDRVAEGLGCEKGTASAELYKLLVYDPSAFFAPHRDTEKAGGMFGTLVVALPSAHRGGELVIRHAGREVTVDLSTAEVSELSWAAFYADCEHEVRPITEGNRVCLVYNLVQRRAGKASSLTAPLYDTEVEAAAKCIAQAMDAPGAPAKIVWLLEHQYSPDGLSFAGLKNADAARVKVLTQAAARAGCAVHLGIVHIEESGSAQENYDGGYGYGRRARWRSDDEEVTEEDAGSGAFEVVEVCDSEQTIDQWVDVQEGRPDFGKIPLGEGELLPDGALDDEKPDEQRFTEATGNEGASFERSYHRAALVLWPQERFADGLLQAGVSAVMPHLKEQADAATAASAEPAARKQVIALAKRVLDVWEKTPPYRYAVSGKEPSRAEMLEILGRLGGSALLSRFAGGIVTQNYDGTENAALAVHAGLLKPEPAGQIFSKMVRANVRWMPGPCVDLLARLLREHEGKPPDAWAEAYETLAAAIVEGLNEVGKVQNTTREDWIHAKRATPVSAQPLADLLDALSALEAGALREEAAANMIARPPVFDPASVIVPALVLLNERHGKGVEGDPAFLRLWQHAAGFLLARSEHPPEAPKDWRQDVELPCKCEDCGALQAFARDAGAHVGRFRVRQDRRQHLHQTIEQHKLDMTHVTERKGSPQTLVCTKTRRTYEQQCKQYRADIRSFAELTAALQRASGDYEKLAARMAEARKRATEWSPGR